MNTKDAFEELNHILSDGIPPITTSDKAFSSSAIIPLESEYGGWDRFMNDDIYD